MPRPPFRLLRLANPAVRAVLESPAHSLLSGTLVVLAYRGHRTGRAFRIPLRYAETPGGRIVALAVRPERKLWWRTFVEPAAATAVLRGARREVGGHVLDGAERRAALRAYLERFPRAAGTLGVRRSPGDAELDGVPAAVVVVDVRA